jgi:hypothetical protein
MRNVKRVDKEFIGAAPGLENNGGGGGGAAADAAAAVKLQLPILGDR